jgi:hypothetical protein
MLARGDPCVEVIPCCADLEAVDVAASRRDATRGGSN